MEIIYSNDLKVLADILTQQIEDYSGSEESVYDECSACVKALYLLLNNCPQQNFIDERKYSRIIEAANQAERNGIFDGKRRKYSKNIKMKIQIWRTSQK